MRFVTIFVCLIAGLLAQDRRIVPTTGTGRRVALVIGNNAYPWKPLKNAANDAKSVADMLPKLGFQARDVTLLLDANLKQMQKAGREFVEKLRPDDLAFVYYSGHGVEVRGENFLIPIDFSPDATELEARDEAYSAQQLLRGLDESHAKTRILILDACRNNPLRANRSAGGGLARMDGQGTLIVFATSAGQTADDNRRGNNGLFTAELLKALPTPGLTVGQMMNEVARSTYRDSGEKQLPALYGLLLEDFPLVAGATPPVATPSRKGDSEAWEMIRGSNNPQDFDDFATNFPNSELTGAARVRAGQLRRASAPVVAPAREPDTSRSKVNAKDGLTYVWIPAGSFQMGCSPRDSECYDDEKPARQMTISNGFWFGQTDVTQAAYQRVVGNNPSNFKGGKLPVEQVNWNEAGNYCRAIGGRLPTEAEWEYAARGGTTGARYGNLDDIAWYSGNSGRKTHEVGQKQPNAYGLYDMLGNVYQWTADSYDANRKSLRVGSWFSDPGLVRVSDRFRLEPAGRSDIIGFRCVGE